VQVLAPSAKSKAKQRRALEMPAGRYALYFDIKFYIHTLIHVGGDICKVIKMRDC
jgi:hypothetical protein